MKKMIQMLQTNITGKLVFILFVLTMGIYATMLIATIPAVQAHAPGLPLFDMSPAGYSFEYAATLLEALGADGRSIYLSQQLPLDFIYPGLFAISYTCLLIWLFRKGFAADSPVFYFAFVPFLAGLFDYIENIGIILMLRSYPNLTTFTVSLTSFTTILKSGCTLVFYLLLLVGIIAIARQKIMNRAQTNLLRHQKEAH
ncbi:MAG: hypothetical protein AB8G95_31040 [Anaerolineae bacterium]